MKLSIVIPCFNEKATILELVDAVQSAPIQDKQIIIVDDGSIDGTREILKGIKARMILISSITRQTKAEEQR
jgi:glycosyltransferase involved in cell wall biosynthesis